MPPRMNQRIQLQEPVVTRDRFGGEVVTWTTRATVPASFERLGKNTERYIRGSNKTVAVRMGKWLINKPHEPFDELWRIVEKDGRELVWNVKGISVPPDRRGKWIVSVTA